MKAETRILICLHAGCEFSLHVASRELPDQCPGCKEMGWWRVADPGEWTKFDRSLLQGKHILAD